MHSSRLGRFAYIAQWWFAVLLPVFFFGGRVALGSGVGWLGLFGVFLVIPTVLIALVPSLVTRADRRVRAARATSSGYAISCIVGWAGGLLAVLGVQDAGDAESYRSTLMLLGSSAEASRVFMFIGLAVALLGWLVSLVFAIADAVAARSVLRDAPA